MQVLFHPLSAQEVNNEEIKIETNSGLTYVFRSDNVNCEQRFGAYEYPQNTWCSASGYTLDLTDSKKPYTKWQMCAVTPANKVLMIITSDMCLTRAASICLQGETSSPCLSSSY